MGHSPAPGLLKASRLDQGPWAAPVPASDLLTQAPRLQEQSTAWKLSPCPLLSQTRQLPWKLRPSLCGAPPSPLSRCHPAPPLPCRQCHPVPRDTRSSCLPHPTSVSCHSSIWTKLAKPGMSSRFAQRQIVTIFGSVGHLVSVTAVQLHHCSETAARNHSKQMCMATLNKTLFIKQTTGHGSQSSYPEYKAGPFLISCKPWGTPR